MTKQMHPKFVTVKPEMHQDRNWLSEFTSNMDLKQLYNINQLQEHEYEHSNNLPNKIPYCKWRKENRPDHVQSWGDHSSGAHE